MSKKVLFAGKNDDLCPQCDGELIIRSGAHGPFHSCSNYPDCDFIRPLKAQADGHIVKVLDDPLCPVCQGQLVLRQGRYGMFIGCINYPECEHIESTSHSDETDIPCPQCKEGKLLQRKSRFGKIFYACDHYPSCQFAINFKPLIGVCAECRYPLLIEKRTAQGIRQYCASKACGQVVKQ